MRLVEPFKFDMNLLKPKFAIDDFIAQSVQVPASQLQLAHLQEWAARLDLKDDLFRRHISFCSQSYQRKRLCRTSRFELLILCWQPGQSSTVHDHADSLNVTRVYQGVLTSRKFGSSVSLTGKQLLTPQEEHLQKDELTAVDSYSIHQLANTSDENLVTLHVYARPLQDIRVYCPISGQSELVPVQPALEEEFTKQ